MASSIASTGACGRDGTLAIRVSAGSRRMAMMSVNVPPISVPTSHSLFKPFIPFLVRPLPSSAPNKTTTEATLLATQVAKVELAMKPVGIAVEVGCHYGILVRLPEQNQRHLLDVCGDHPLAHFFVLGRIKFKARLGPQFGHTGIVPRTVVPALVAGKEVTEEVIGGRKPCRRPLGKERQPFVGEGGPLLGAGHFLNSHFVFVFARPLLEGGAHRLGAPRRPKIDR